jgi:Reverse transcriptase (RNA-dependent DNA polymerase)
VVNAGVKGVFCPRILFAVYIDQLIRALEFSNHRCVVHGVYLGCIVYADDIFIMSHSSSSIQSMLDVCSIEISKLHLNFNSKGSVILRIGTWFNSNCAPLSLDGNVLQSVTNVRYLGIFIKSGIKMVCSFEHIR